MNDRTPQFLSSIHPLIPSPLEGAGACTLCPRRCGARRAEGQLGYCRSGTGFALGAICTHRGEEPPICGPHGIANVFFARCNMQCVFCQNHQISRNEGPIIERQLSLEEAVRCIEAALGRGVGAVGFVSPSHCIPQMKAIIAALRDRQPKPAFVMNTNAYDTVETLASLDGLIDAYLPDLKYMDAELAARYSDAPDYPAVATRAIAEMFRQKGTRLAIADSGYVESGLTIRHLVLPGHVENSKLCLRWIADTLSTDVHVSLMAQYRPTPAVAGHPHLGRCLRPDEYQEVLDELHRLGFWRGWTQALASPSSYQPDFTQSHPFERA
ncbi:MAG: radical SAM protein [Planctomycetes bacterium]|nr:radical SAM protein [Planctomycetota bacterium]